MLCLDSSRPINQWEHERLATCQSQILVWTKCDLPRQIGQLPYVAIETSALTHRGIYELRAAITVYDESLSVDDRARILAAFPEAIFLDWSTFFECGFAPRDPQ